MAFNSLTYLAFLAAAVTAFWIIPSSWRRGFVLLVSVVFYATWGVAFIAVPFAVAGLIWAIGRKIAGQPTSARQWSSIGISILLLVLGFFKYRGFVLNNFSSLFKHDVHGMSWLLAFGMPIGISFFTFEAIAYLIDVRQKRVPPASFFDLCILMLFWPTIIAGPILRARELVSQLNFSQSFEAGFVFEGLDRVVWGLVQKGVFANTLSMWVDKGFTGSTAPPTLDAWFLAIGYGLQIYFDFAGYSNVAIGAARLIGIQLPENFRYPYHAKTPSEFWSRWHMSLSRWIRDYLFFPINAKYKGASTPLYLSLLGVMALVGLWHGAGWTFVLWGAMHGAYLVLQRIYDSAGGKHTSAIDVVWRIATLMAVVAAWVPFRAASLAQAGSILRSMFLRFTAGHTYSALYYEVVIAGFLFCAVEPWLSERHARWEKQASGRWASLSRIVARPLAYACGILLFVIFDIQNVGFIYSKF